MVSCRWGRGSSTACFWRALGPGPGDSPADRSRAEHVSPCAGAAFTRRTAWQRPWPPRTERRIYETPSGVRWTAGRLLAAATLPSGTVRTGSKRDRGDAVARRGGHAWSLSRSRDEPRAVSAVHRGDGARRSVAERSSGCSSSVESGGLARAAPVPGTDTPVRWVIASRLSDPIHQRTRDIGTAPSSVGRSSPVSCVALGGSVCTDNRLGDRPSGGAADAVLAAEGGRVTGG